MPAILSKSGLSQVTKLSGRKYHLIQEIKNWTEARDYCRSNYIDLISIRSPEEEKVIASLLEPDEWHWIGLYNDEQSSDGWKWTTGERINYSHWAPWYPKDFNITSPVCVYINQDQWFNFQCYFVLPFICFTELPQPFVAAETEVSTIKPAEPLETGKNRTRTLQRSMSRLHSSAGGQQSSISRVLPAKHDSLSGSGETQVKPLPRLMSPKYTSYSDYVQSIRTGERMYFLIDKKKSWPDARSHCQFYYSDLLSLRNQEEERIVAPLLSEMKWIGLHNDQAAGWTWTNGDKYHYENWSPSYPYIYATGLPVCAFIASDGWREEECDALMPFICYLDLRRPPGVLTQRLGSVPEAGDYEDITLEAVLQQSNFKTGQPQSVRGTDRVYYLIEEGKTWSKAWGYCRTYYSNLVSIRDAEEARVIAFLQRGPQWIGLYNDGLSGWMWTNGDELSYTKWAFWHPYSFNNTLPMCACAFDSEWHEADCDFPFTFICYKDSQISLDHSQLRLQPAEPIHYPRSDVSSTSVKNFEHRNNFKVDSVGRTYHKVELEKTWPDARDYCLTHHTDLLSIRNLQDSLATTPMFQQIKLGWCGLYNDKQTDNGWKWANGDEVSYTNWKPGNPYRFRIISPVCVYVEEGQWSDAPCRFLFPFICYTELLQNPNPPSFSPFDFGKFSVQDEQNPIPLLSAKDSFLGPQIFQLPDREYFFIKKEKTWSEAQDYCRTQYTDLVSIRHVAENNRTARLLKEDAPAWIGLFNEHQSEYGWMWTNGDVAKFLNWDNFYPMDFGTMSVCVIMLNSRWKDVPCDFTFPFICYTGE
ncbi:macrophage mannose receptor 1-like [Heptranchias perlo]|uniref:macrophage mannose receptor 1-like n=1 Tax=Heptranchias perlo TaxID=212740 RepID=UPI00355A2B80